MAKEMPQCPVCYVPMATLRPDGTVSNHQESTTGLGGSCAGSGSQPEYVDMGYEYPVGVSLDQ